MAMIFGDYVAGFLGLARDGSSWSMNPFDVRLRNEVSSLDHSHIPIATINSPSRIRTASRCLAATVINAQ